MARPRRPRYPQPTRHKECADFISASWGVSPRTTSSRLAMEYIGRQAKSPRDAKSGWHENQIAATDTQLSPWQQLSQVLLLTNEFMYVD